MARYDRRDYLQHWVAKEQPADRPCTHACCRGYKQHPEHWPVVLPARRLRAASDDQLAARFGKLTARPGGDARRAEAQVLAEMQRRDDAERAAQRRAERVKQRQEAVAANRAVAQMDREADAERIRREAESATQGYLVNAQGRARGITDAEILTGREAVFRRYATDEAREYFSAHPRPTGAYLRYGRDTRVHERATERPKRARRGLAAFR